MDNIYGIAVIVNTLCFGHMAFSNSYDRMRFDWVMHMPTIFSYLFENVVSLILTVAYFISFVVIVFSADSLIKGIITVLVLQFLFNHFLWGFAVGLFESYFFIKPRMKGGD